MELKLEKRKVNSKSHLGEIKRAGNIPAVVYVRGKESAPVIVNGAAFQANLRMIPKGCLATQKFDIELDGKKAKAIVKDISYHRTTYAIEHIDLMIVADNDEVSINVPVVAKGEDVCPGIIQGGQLKLVRRSVKLTLKGSEIPQSFVVQVGHLNLGESVRARDIPMTGGMKMRIRADQILVTVSK